MPHSIAHFAIAWAQDAAGAPSKLRLGLFLTLIKRVGFSADAEMERRDAGGVIAGGIATHSIAENAIEWATLACLGPPVFVGTAVLGCPADQLNGPPTPEAWNSEFGNSDNDGVVPVAGQVNGDTSASYVLSRYIHTRGIKELGFTGFSELDAGAIPAFTIDLLNEPKTGKDFQHP